MLNNIQLEFLRTTAQAAQTAGHVWPQMAAAEAALESGYGFSGLVKKANNLFGMKQHNPPIYDTLELPTREYLNNQWITVTAKWVKYPDLAACFKDRMDTLKRLSKAYPHYAAALAAPDPVAFVTEVSKTWSTDPNRAQKVITIYNAFIQQ